MPKGMSACGVMCSGCAAYLGQAKGLAHQERTVAAWRRIYGLKESAANISCGGCLSPDDQVFHTSVRCKARRCCRDKGLESCAACSQRPCPDLERAQSVWDGVPEIAKSLGPADLEAYARPYCGHRERLAARQARRRTKSPHRD
jgi:Protein of unknown function (DUF3795)